MRRFQARHGLIDRRHRARADAARRSTCRPRCGSRSCKHQSDPAAQHERQSRQPLRGRATSRRRGSRRSRAASRFRATPRSSASRTGRRPTSTRKIVEINFNPYWTVPVSIVRRDLIPKMQAEPDYLANNHIRIFDMRGNELTPRRSTGIRRRRRTTASSRIRAISIRSARCASISRARTASTCTTRRSKGLFGEDMRFHSSGCVRVQNVRELVDWLLVETPTGRARRSTR